jgi:hypothetical protein
VVARGSAVWVQSALHRRCKKEKGKNRSRWQRRTLPRGRPRSTIRAGELNCRVRDGAGWTLTALATNNTPALPSFSQVRYRCCFALCFPHACTHAPEYPPPRMTGVRPRPLVRVSSTHHCASTSRLSSWSSASGLTWFSSGGSHLEAGFPLRCFQRFSAPEIATRLCHWRGNRHTSAPSIPVLSY